MLTVSFVHIGTTGNCKIVKEKLLGFVMVYKLACTEVHGSNSCIKRVDRFCTKYQLASLKFRDPLEQAFSQDFESGSPNFMWAKGPHSMAPAAPCSLGGLGGCSPRKF